MKRIAVIAYCLVGACADNPFGRPATLVDGEEFPATLQGTIAPKVAFHDGDQVSLYLLGDAPAAVGEVIELLGDGARPFPRCVTRQRDDDGALVDTDLEACQGVILPALPGDDDYTPFVRVHYVQTDGDYELNSVRSVEELEDRGLTPQASDAVVDYAVISPAANVADPAGKLPRVIGWYRALELVYLEAAREVPVDGEGNVVSMDLLVPDGYDPGGGGDVLTARAGEAGYSPRCRVVTFAVPAGYMPGDIKNAADIPVAGRTPTDTYVHCIAP